MFNWIWPYPYPTHTVLLDGSDASSTGHGEDGAEKGLPHITATETGASSVSDVEELHHDVHGDDQKRVEGAFTKV